MVRWLCFALCTLALAGCSTAIEFKGGAPFSTDYVVKEGVIVSVPDELPARTLRIRIGGFLDQHYYLLPVGDAYRDETVSRMNGLFTEGVTITTYRVADQLPTLKETNDEALKSASGESARLDELYEKIKERERDDSRTQESVLDLTNDALAEAAKETIAQKNSIYILRYATPLLGFVDQRVVVSFRAQLADRRTGNLLLDKRYQGRSRRFDPADSVKTNEDNLVSLVRQAFSGAMNQMVEDIAVATDAAPRTPVQR